MSKKLALAILCTIHLLGMLGAPYAASLHLHQEGSTAHQNFHVVWEACKYFTASLFAFLVVLFPLRRGERWARWAVLGGTIVMFGGVFFSDAVTGGSPPIDNYAYGTFLVLSLVALALLRERSTSSATTGTSMTTGRT